jgi:thioredoxin-like negative regulator of GroEL
MFTYVMIALAAVAAAIVFFALRKDLGGKSKTKSPSGASVPEVSALQLREMLTASPAPVVVMFHSPNCPACHTQKPNFQEAADTHKGNARFVTINVLDNKSTSRRLGITRIPTTMVFAKDDVTPLASRVGVFDPASVNAFITNAVK